MTGPKLVARTSAQAKEQAMTDTPLDVVREQLRQDAAELHALAARLKRQGLATYAARIEQIAERLEGKHG